MNRPVPSDDHNRPRAPFPPPLVLDDALTNPSRVAWTLRSVNPVRDPRRAEPIPLDVAHALLQQLLGRSRLEIHDDIEELGRGGDLKRGDVLRDPDGAGGERGWLETLRGLCAAEEEAVAAGGGGGEAAEDRVEAEEVTHRVGARTERDRAVPRPGAEHEAVRRQFAREDGRHESGSSQARLALFSVHAVRHDSARGREGQGSPRQRRSRATESLHLLRCFGRYAHATRRDRHRSARSGDRAAPSRVPRSR